MPCINVKTNAEISSDQEQMVKEQLGQAITCIPGKSESWLMVTFEDQVHMYFKGKADQRMAFVEVKIYGSASAEDYDRLTGEITKILETNLGIPPSQIYVKYEEVSYWGWNGNNF
ncbi:phenylpyruvate tautomerase MIF-related protein [Diplocloster hominis]|uniref:phenylpyruvate tautomerase MIF-related protein n=1 Tax=Diplocloster hominis TaxID=3079010 RepID=UPI0031BA081E